MNHGKEFQQVHIERWPGANKQLNKDIKADVARMQSQGNYGDGALIADGLSSLLTLRFLV